MAGEVAGEVAERWRRGGGRVAGEVAERWWESGGEVAMVEGLSK